MTAFGTKIELQNESHLIGEFVGNTDGPTLVAVGSIHGNEPSGRLALERVTSRLESLREKLRGRVYLLLGNVRASSRSVRFIDSDLNRHWTTENIRRNTRFSPDLQSEDREQHELLATFSDILHSAGDEAYVLDLHSTSAGGVPFATVGDTLRKDSLLGSSPLGSFWGSKNSSKGRCLSFLTTREP